jgi:hypothetical protein
MLFAALTMFVIVAVSHNSLAAPGASKEIAPEPLLWANAIPAMPEETELVTIFRTGFDPSEITRPAGKFTLEVDDRSELEEVGLQLDREGGGPEASATVRNTAPEWRVSLDLPAGVYVLSATNHPNWSCRITLTSTQ